MAESRKQGRSPLDAFVRTDEATGKPCLKIPMPDPKTVESAVSALGALMETFKAFAESSRKGSA